MGTLKKRLRDKGGGTMLGTAAGMVTIILFIAIAITVAPVFTGIATADRVAQDVVRHVEAQGDASYAYSEFTRLAAIRNLKNSSVSINQSGRLQLDDEFTVTVTYMPVIKVGLVIDWPLSISRKATGRSEKYWKWGAP